MSSARSPWDRPGPRQVHSPADACMVGRQSHGRRRRASGRTRPPPAPRRPPRRGPAPPARGATAHRPARRAPYST
eukprot:scaffold138916_cov199-Phaeocystis_antarctica.AAC.1